MLHVHMPVTKSLKYIINHVQTDLQIAQYPMPSRYLAKAHSSNILQTAFSKKNKNKKHGNLEQMDLEKYTIFVVKLLARHRLKMEHKTSSFRHIVKAHPFTEAMHGDL